MQARSLFETPAFEPETLHVLYEAFDRAWEEIAPHFDGADDRARMQLAHALLIIAREDSKDAESLKTVALQVMALAYRTPESVAVENVS
jgi:hypothetical protein